MTVTIDGTNGVTSPGITDTGNLSVSGTSTLTGAVSQTGSSTAASFIPSGATIPTNGVFLPSANTVAIATNSTNQVSISSTGIVTGTAGNLMLVQGAVQASTSGTSINFTSVIPTWAKRVTMAFNGVSTGSTNNLIIQLGTGGTATITGYSAQTTGIASSSGATSSSTVGFPIYHNVATYAWSGVVTLQNVSGNIWVAGGVLGNATTTALSAFTSGVVTLAGALDTIRVIASATGAPSDTFDAGSINIQWE
jgi:hypothetical protein